MLRVLESEQGDTEDTRTVTMKFDGDFMSIYDRQMEFGVALYKKLDLPESVHLSKFKFASGKYQTYKTPWLYNEGNCVSFVDQDECDEW